MDDNRPRTLRDVAQAASDRHGGARGRRLGEVAHAAGLTLSYTTVDKILAGTYTSRPTPPTLDALARLSGIARADVYAAAGVPMPLKPLAEDLPPGADLLSPGQRRVVIDVVREFAKLQRELHDKRAGEEHVDSASTSKGVNRAGGLTPIHGLAQRRETESRQQRPRSRRGRTQG